MRPLLLALLLPWAAFAQAPPELSEIPEELHPLLEERDEEGEPVISPELRRKLAGLSEASKQHLAYATELMILSNARHLRVLLSLELSPEGWELALSDNCLVCHSDPVAQEPVELMAPDPEAHGAPPHMDLEAFLQGAHFKRGLSCSGCHGGTPQDEYMMDEVYERWPSREERSRDRSWLPEFCGGCHADSERIGAYAPALPTDQLQKYRNSHHGRALLQEGDSKAAQCVSCHGAHGITGASRRGSPVHPSNVPATCGECHADEAYMEGQLTRAGQPMPTGQLAEFRQSVHGRALLERGSQHAPACNDCHGNHSSFPPQVSRLMDVCRVCHSKVAEVQRPTAHRAFFLRQGWGECGRCHGDHGVKRPTPRMIDVSPDGLCGGCHAEFAKDPTGADLASAHFRAVLTTFTDSDHRLREQTERLAERGVDVEALELALDEVHQSLIESRVQVHSFSVRDFDQAAAGGHEAITRAEALVEAGWEEFSWRKAGLTGAIGAMVLLALGMLLKIRDVERRRRSGGSGPPG